jgi:carotenoid cleavage dioxygenase
MPLRMIAIGGTVDRDRGTGALSMQAGADLPISRANIAITAPDGTPPPDAPDWIWSQDNPYLHGMFAPTAREYEAEALNVEGELPRDLCGAYVLNGPSQRFAPANRYHYYDGDAMLRAIYFRDGRASFRQRWVRNEAFVAEDVAGKSIWPGLNGPYNFALPGSPIKDTANTDLVFHAGSLIALWYMAGKPYAIDPLTLETRGKHDFGGQLRHTLSAHSKVDPRTGELFFFTYADEPPYMRYGVIGPDGALLHDVPIDLPGPRSPHDMGLTENYAILHDLPLFHDVALLREHKKRVLRFHRDMPARFGVIPRRGDPDQIRWFEADSCYILHLVNCWEEGEWVHQVGCRLANPASPRDPKDGELASALALRRRVHTLYRWSFNMRTGAVREGTIDDLNTEFPMVNANWRGRKTRYSFNQHLPLPVAGSVAGQCQTFDALVRYDLETGVSQRYAYGEGVFGNEAPVAPRVGSTDERDAYAVTFVTDTNDWRSSCLVFDAADITRGPVARIGIPHRVSAGFHATWIRGEDIFAL